MKLMIASDIHGDYIYAEKLKKLFEEKNCDSLILLGDLLYHGPRNNLPLDYNTKQTAEILNSMKEKIIAVRGNCDSEVDQMVLEFSMSEPNAIINVDNRNWFLTHGHIYNENYLPSFKNIDVLLNGHFHIPTFTKHDTYIYINPGSTSIPKQNSKNSVCIYENSKIDFYNLDNFEVYRSENF